MNIRTAISKVRGLLKETTGDTSLSNRLIYSAIHSAMTTLIERNKERLAHSDIFTTIEETPEIVNLSEVSCIPLDCEVCRIKLKNPLYTKNGVAIRFVGSQDGSFVMRVISPSQYQRKISLRGNKTKYAFVENGYLYLQECLPCVKVEYVSSGIDNAGCGVLDTELNIPNYLEAAMFQLAIQELSIYVQRPLDAVQNKNPNQ